MINRSWFEMIDVRTLSRGAAWIPLRQSERSEGAMTSIEAEEFFGIATLAVEAAR